MTIASGQITFSKELVLGSPKRVNLYEDKTCNRIAVKAATRGEVRFVDGSRGKKGRKDAKVVYKEPWVLALFHSYVEPLKLGSYYCVDAQILEYEKAAIFDMCHPALHLRKNSAKAVDTIYSILPSYKLPYIALTAA